MMLRFWLAALAMSAAPIWPSAALAQGADAMRKARNHIEARQFKAALDILADVSPCNARCRYAKALAHSQLGDRPNTRLMATSLINDAGASTAMRAAAAKLLVWADDQRLRQQTGRRTVRRRDLGGYELSIDTCSNDAFVLRVEAQQWTALGVDPDDIYVPPALRPCDVGPPIVTYETYEDRCIRPALLATEPAEAEGAPSDTGADGLNWTDYEWGDPVSSSGPTEIVLEPRGATLECSAFDPPVVGRDELEALEAAP